MPNPETTIIHLSLFDWQQLQRELSDLQQRVQELEQRLQQQGIMDHPDTCMCRKCTGE